MTRAPWQRSAHRSAIGANSRAIEARALRTGRPGSVARRGRSENGTWSLRPGRDPTRAANRRGSVRSDRPARPCRHRNVVRRACERDHGTDGLRIVRSDERASAPHLGSPRASGIRNDAVDGRVSRRPQPTILAPTPRLARDRDELRAPLLGDFGAHARTKRSIGEDRPDSLCRCRARVDDGAGEVFRLAQRRGHAFPHSSFEIRERVPPRGRSARAPLARGLPAGHPRSRDVRARPAAPASRAEDHGVRLIILALFRSA